MISELWMDNHNFNIMKHRLLLFTLIAMSLMTVTSCCNNAKPADAVFENIFNRKSAGGINNIASVF